MLFSSLAAPGFLRGDFLTTVKAAAGGLRLEADPAHGGVHYRAEQCLNGSKTEYFYPMAKLQPHLDLDYS